MSTLILCLMCVSICCLMSCSGRKETAEEEKIHIIVEHKKDDNQIDRQPRAPETVRSDVDKVGIDQMAAPPSEDEDIAQEKRIQFHEVRRTLRNMIQNDDQLKDLIAQGHVAPLAEYLLSHHKAELDAICRQSQIKDERIAAFRLSRMMIRKPQRLKARPEQLK